MSKYTRKNMYDYVMSVNEKFGCLLYSTDLTSIHQEEQTHRRRDKQSGRHTINKRTREQRVVKPIDFFLYNEIIMSNALSENDDIYGSPANGRFENYLHSFSSFIPIKSKREVGSNDELIRSENDDPTSEITYGAFNYVPKGVNILRYLGASKTRTSFCANLTTTYKKTLDSLLYLKKNEAVHLGLSHHMVTIDENGASILDGVKYVRFHKDINERVIKTTANDKGNEMSPIFAPIELSFYCFCLTMISPQCLRIIYD